MDVIILKKNMTNWVRITNMYYTWTNHIYGILNGKTLVNVNQYFVYLNNYIISLKFLSSEMTNVDRSLFTYKQ